MPAMLRNIGSKACQVLTRVFISPANIAIVTEFMAQANWLLLSANSVETADTLAALKDVVGKVAARLALVNVPTSSLAREADHVLDIAAGPEIGVASIKAFTAQMLALLIIAIKAGVDRGQIARSDLSRLLDEADGIAGAVRAEIALEPQVKQIAEEIASARDVIFLGRGITYPLALEAALELKEVSYIHAEGYAAGELKHGPIALIDADVPVVVFASRGALQEKTLGNAAEVAARGSRVIMVGCDDGADIRLAPSSDLAVLFAYAVVAQLLAYHTALARGTDVDQPRNLAKSVTVE
jgi:glutamine---fructose-6-phosphate transaminase (isomerizing)